MQRSMKVTDSNNFGKMGEDSAAAFLCGKGYKILCRNYRTGHLETDIIAEKDGCIVFAEVKTRSEYPNVRHPFGRPAAAVDHSKRQRLMNAVLRFQKENADYAKNKRVRIDIIEVYTLPGSEKYKVLKIVHMENAVRP